MFLSVIFNSILLAAPKASLRIDKSTFPVRSFNKSALKEYASSSDFKYRNEKLDVSPSLWDQFWNWFWSLFNDAFSNAASGGYFKYFFIALGAAVIIYAIIKFSGMDMSAIFTGKAKSAELPYTQSLENIHEISFDSKIDEAIKLQNYRLAVRLLYLKSLKVLSDSGTIKWQPDKMNAEYINELKNSSQKKKFSWLTHQFEYVWYGSFPLNGDSFNKIQSSFQDFNRGRY